MTAHWWMLDYHVKTSYCSAACMHRADRCTRTQSTVNLKALVDYCAAAFGMISGGNTSWAG
jgi:hypothetical protein